MTQETAQADLTPKTISDPIFFEKFSTKKFFNDELGITEEEIQLLDSSSFFNNNADYDNYYIVRPTDRIINKAIINATEQRLEFHTVLLYLKDSYPHLNAEGDKYFFSHFVNPEFVKLKDSFLKEDKIHPREFLSLLLLADINSRRIQEEANDRLSNAEEPSEVLVDIVKRELDE